ncbi:hypothetical protein [Kitasatospora camelliae]|uniref:Zinc finger protein n=1 Tax=Kitasatospora camelliae TaxID=3156397 RepID=A0AAU8K4A2_9ACTN
MRCGEFRDAVAAWVDGEAGGEPVGMGHLAGCAGCAEWVEGLRRLRSLTEAAPGPSEEWERGLLARLGVVPGPGGGEGYSSGVH